jgi:multiple sugar transport system substrate-binding protein
MTVTLRGMTWSHPRGYDPMIACSDLFRERTGVEIRWDKRSLQDFESFPVQELAAAYDLIVIDHPHVGQITAEGCLHPLDGPTRKAELAALAKGSVGPSFASYDWQGRQWALPIDAATQVQAYRPDRLDGPVRQLEDMVLMARRGRALLPLRPPHSLMCFYTLAAHLGQPCHREGEVLIEREAGLAVMDWLFRLAEPQPDMAYGADPIAVFEEVCRADSAFSVVPFAYGYVSYSLHGFRPARLAFADMPVVGARPPTGSAIGGTGIAVSASSGNRAAAEDFAFFLASGAVQAGPYAAAGGQPGHAEAWEADGVNGPVLDFYRNTRATLEGGWLRPRHDGYMRFQEEGSQVLTAGLKARSRTGEILDQLDALFRAHGPKA